MKQAILFLLLVSSIAYGSIYQRQHSDTIVADKKILADDLNDEFNAILTAVNSIDSSNITDGSLTATDFAATSSGVITNRKFGCPISRLNDGVVGFKAVAITFDYVYARQSGASLAFKFSATPPLITTARKTGDSTARYLGTVLTGSASNDIVDFSKNGNDTRLDDANNNIERAGRIATLTSVSADYNIATPAHFTDVYLKYRAYTSTAYPAQCDIEASDFRPDFPVVVIATGGNDGLIPFSIPLEASGTLDDVRYVNVKECVNGVDVRLEGWIEPHHLQE